MTIMRNTDQLKRFYEDAIYWHLIKKGYTEDHARSIALQVANRLVISL